MWEGEIGGRSAKCVIAVDAFKCRIPCTCILLGFGAIFSFTLLCISGGSDACVLYGSEGQGVSFRNSKTAWLGIALYGIHGAIWAWATCGQLASRDATCGQLADNLRPTCGQLAANLRAAMQLAVNLWPTCALRAGWSGGLREALVTSENLLRNSETHEKFGPMAVRRTAGRGAMVHGSEFLNGFLHTSQTPYPYRAVHIYLGEEKSPQ